MPHSSTIALITGANKGIGLETARQLAASGITVLLGCRDESRARSALDGLRAHGRDAHVVTLDVTSAASITAAAARIGEEFGRLDILINNAGVMLHGRDGPLSTTGDDALRETFETNFFGLAAVTRAMLPLLRKSQAGRIVNVSSILGSVAEHADPNSTIHSAKFLGYDASKAAVNMLTNHLAHELRDTPIKVNAAHPGWVKTDMGGEGADLDLETGARTSVRLATLPASGPSGGYYHLESHLRW